MVNSLDLYSTANSSRETFQRGIAGGLGRQKVLLLAVILWPKCCICSNSERLK